MASVSPIIVMIMIEGTRVEGSILRPAGRKRVGIMQPYFLPYIGYFNLMNVVDELILYDNIEFSKGGWINRNRILCGGHAEFMTIPLKKASDYLDIRERQLSEEYPRYKRKLLNKLHNSYYKAPYYKEVLGLVNEIFSFEEKNLFEFIFFSISKMRDFLGIQAGLRISSEFPIEQEATAEMRVIETALEAGANIYINLPGGVHLYQTSSFVNRGLELQFIVPRINMYKQFEYDFVSSLSILDVLMFNDRDKIRHMLNEYDLFTQEELLGQNA